MAPAMRNGIDSPSGDAVVASSVTATTISVAVVRLDPELPLPGLRPRRVTPAPIWWPGRAVTLAPGGGRAMVPTGIAVAIPAGYAGFVQPRSGLALRHGVTCLNTPGLIDSGYRDELAVLLVNTDPDTPYEVRTRRPDRPAGGPAGGDSGVRRGATSSPTATGDSRASGRRGGSGGAAHRPGRGLPLVGVADHPPADPRGPGLRPDGGAAAAWTSGPSAASSPTACRWCPRSGSGGGGSLRTPAPGHGRRSRLRSRLPRPTGLPA